MTTYGIHWCIGCVTNYAMSLSVLVSVISWKQDSIQYAVTVVTAPHSVLYHFHNASTLPLLRIVVVQPQHRQQNLVSATEAHLLIFYTIFV